MKLLDNITKDKVKTLGLKSIRDSFESGREYTLVRSGNRLLVIDSESYNEAMGSIHDFKEIEGGRFLKTPDGIFEIEQNTSTGWVVNTDNGLDTILKPEDWGRVPEPEEVEVPEELNQKTKPFYPMNEFIDLRDNRLSNPPYPTMNTKLWRQSLDLAKRYGTRVLPYQVLQIYKQLKR